MLKIMKKIKNKKINFHNFPDKHGRFGKFGGRFVAETLMPLLIDVEKEYLNAKKSSKFKNQLNYYFKIILEDQVHFILLRGFLKNLTVQKSILNVMNLITRVLTK